MGESEVDGCGGQADLDNLSTLRHGLQQSLGAVLQLVQLHSNRLRLGVFQLASAADKKAVELLVALPFQVRLQASGKAVLGVTHVDGAGLNRTDRLDQ